MIISITLDQLSCNTETEGGGSHPYLWAVLLQVDDKTIASGALVAEIAFAPSPTGAQIIIAEGMRAAARPRFRYRNSGWPRSSTPARSGGT
jgi:hypothetical protein